MLHNFKYLKSFLLHLMDKNRHIVLALGVPYFSWFILWLFNINISFKMLKVEWIQNVTHILFLHNIWVWSLKNKYWKYSACIACIH